MAAELAASEQQSARFWGRMAARYSRSPIRDLEAYERKLDMTRALLRPDLRPVLPALRLVGLAPRVTFLSRERLEAAFERAGFEIEHAWQPDKRSTVFHVMRKARHGGG